MRRELAKKILVWSLAAALALLTASSTAVSAQVEDRRLDAEVESALRAVIDEEMSHEELNGLLWIFRRSIAGLPIESRAAVEGGSQAEGLQTLEQLTEAGLVPELAVQAIERTLERGSEFTNALRTIASVRGEDEDFERVAREVAPRRWDSMVLSVRATTPEGDPIPQLDVTFLQNGAAVQTAKSDAEGVAQFDFAYDREMQESDLIVGRTFGYVAESDGHGSFERTGLHWARGEWIQTITLDGSDQVDRQTHGSILRAYAEGILASVGEPALAHGTSSSEMCNGHDDTVSHPNDTSVPLPAYDIKIGITDSSGDITAASHVDFKDYVKNVLPNEWIPGWGNEALEAGGMAIKEYAWYRGLTEGKHDDGIHCYDGTDDTNFQVYVAGSNQTSTDLAVDEWWGFAMYHGGDADGWFEATYRAGSASTSTCGSHNNSGTMMRQWGTKACDDDGLKAKEIIGEYYFDGADVARACWAPPTNCASSK